MTYFPPRIFVLSVSSVRPEKAITRPDRSRIEKDGKYVAVVDVNPATVLPPVFAGAEGASEEPPVAVEEDEDGKTKVSVTIGNAVIGLWYGYEVANALGAGVAFENDNGSFKRATNATFKVEATPRTEPSGFFRVKVLPARPAE